MTLPGITHAWQFQRQCMKRGRVPRLCGREERVGCESCGTDSGKVALLQICELFASLHTRYTTLNSTLCEKGVQNSMSML